MLRDSQYRVLGTNEGSPATQFGAQDLTALYAHARRGATNDLHIGVGGAVLNGNRIVVFLDSCSGGFNTGNFGRTGAPGGLSRSKSETTFDTGFAAGYALNDRRKR